MLYHNEPMLRNTVKMREAGYGEARHHAEGQGPRGLLWTSRSCSAICSAMRVSTTRLQAQMDFTEASVQVRLPRVRTGAFF